MKKIAFAAMVLSVAALCAHLWITHAASSENYLQRAADADEPNMNFLFASNASLPGRLYMTFSGKYFKPCINTVTSFYNRYHTCSNCEDFVKNPGKWNFRKTEHPEPGDIIIQHDPKTGRAYHAVILTRIEDGKYYINHAVRKGYLKDVELKNKSNLTFYEYIGPSALCSKN